MQSHTGLEASFDLRWSLPVAANYLGSFASCAYQARITLAYFYIIKMFKLSRSVKLVFCFGCHKLNPLLKKATLAAEMDHHTEHRD